jgi:hypothetical protein
VIAQGGRLRALDAVKPLEIHVSDRAEGDGSVRFALNLGGARGELALGRSHETILFHDGGVLVEKARLGASAAPLQTPLPIPLKPSRPKATLHGL